MALDDEDKRIAAAFFSGIAVGSYCAILTYLFGTARGWW